MAVFWHLTTFLQGRHGGRATSHTGVPAGILALRFWSTSLPMHPGGSRCQLTCLGLCPHTETHVELLAPEGICEVNKWTEDLCH